MAITYGGQPDCVQAGIWDWFGIDSKLVITDNTPKNSEKNNLWLKINSWSTRQNIMGFGVVKGMLYFKYVQHHVLSLPTF